MNKEYYGYEVSSDGYIVSKSTKKPMKAQLGKEGYYKVKLRIDGKYKNYLLHRIIAEVWCENDDPDNKTQVDHIDGNPKNNAADNLEWVTPKENIRRAKQRRLAVLGSHQSTAAKETVILDTNTGDIFMFSSRKAACRHFGIHESHFDRLCGPRQSSTWAHLVDITNWTPQQLTDYYNKAGITAQRGEFIWD